MRLTTALAVAAVLGAVACKKNDGTVATGSGSGSAVVSAPPVAMPADATVTPVAWKLPAGAAAADEKADASALGPTVIAHFVERVQTNQSNGARYIKLVLVLEGAGGAIAADVTDTVVAQDGAKDIMAISGAADVVLA